LQGIIECDVSFTSDRELVCRHSNCDLQYTTNILSKPDLAAKCTEPFTPADPANGTDASAKCCTSDITLAEFKGLCAEMEATTFNALSINASSPYFGRIGTTPDWRTNMYAYSCAEPMSLKEQIEQVDAYGLNFTAEAKTPEVPMPFQGNYTQTDFIKQIVDTFDGYKINPDRVWLQSFLPDDIFWWIDNTPAYGLQAVYLDERADLTADGYDVAVSPSVASRSLRLPSTSSSQPTTPPTRSSHPPTQLPRKRQVLRLSPGHLSARVLSRLLVVDTTMPASPT
jgi:glycerophosphoryl diester phosphodiesterase